MSWLTAIAREDIRALRAYEHAAWEPSFVRLHANESPWRAHGDRSEAGLNRYPEPHPYELSRALAEFYGVPPSMLLPGRGSDELIDLLIRSYCQAGRDAVLICPPTFGMYAVTARIQGAAVYEVALRAENDWQLEPEALLHGAQQSGRSVKLVFVCTPNNPTGNRLEPAVILELSRALQGRALVVVDEAYVDFEPDRSLVPKVAETPGLVVLRTLSKAHGLAGARCGVAVAHAEVIELLRKVIQPYAVTQLTIEAVLAALQPAALAATHKRLATLRAERARVIQGLRDSPRVRRVWPSEANFLLVDFIDAGEALQRAHDAGLLLRDMRRSGALEQALRISLGTPEENGRLLAILQ